MVKDKVGLDHYTLCRREPVYVCFFLHLASPNQFLYKRLQLRLIVLFLLMS